MRSITTIFLILASTLFVIAQSEVDNKMASDWQEIASIKDNRGDLISSYELSKIFIVNYNSNKSRTKSLYIDRLFDIGILSYEVGSYLISRALLNEYLENSKSSKSSNPLKIKVAGTYLALTELALGNLSYALGLITDEFNNLSKEEITTVEGYKITYALAYILSQSGKYAQSETYFNQIVTQSSDSENMGEFKIKLFIEYGLLEINLGNLKKANQLFGRASNLIETELPSSHPYHRQLLNAYLKLYLTAEMESKSDSIMSKINLPEYRYYKASHDIFDENENVINYYLLKGDLSRANNLTDSLINSFDKEFGKGHYKSARYLSLKSLVQYRMGNYEEALGFGESALKQKGIYLDYEHPDYLESLSLLAYIYWANEDYKSAKRYFLKSIYFYKRKYESNFAFLSEHEKALFYADIRKFFDVFNCFVLQYGASDPSLYIEMINNQLISKGLLFTATKQMKEKAKSSPKLQSIYNDWLLARENLNKAKKVEDDQILMDLGIDIEELEEKANSLEKDLSLYAQIGQGSNSSEVDPNWSEIRYLLSGNEAAIEIVRVPVFDPKSGGRILEDSTLYAGLIISKRTRKSPEVIILKDGHFMETRAVNFYRNSIKYKMEDKTSYDWFWKDFSNSGNIKGADRVYISPDGVYNQINPNTLFDAESEKYVNDKMSLTSLGNLKDIKEAKDNITQLNKQSGDYLLMGFPEYNIDIRNSTSVVKLDNLIPANTDSSGTRGLMGNMFNGEMEVPMLPGTLNEISMIDSLLDKNNINAEVYLSSKATEGKLKEINSKSKSPTVLHISTHGFFLEPDNNSNELTGYSIDPLNYSGLLFTGAAYGYNEDVALYEIKMMSQNKVFDDGILTAYEAMNLNLNETQLVIMSACETGLGVIQSGEGVFGLQRSMQTAGAKSVIMSLWKVDDTATNMFMQYFYKFLLQGKSRSVAFEDAKLELRKVYSHPYYWGAFVLIGT